jgi:uncharacterized membrane protein (UPF0136 family)
MHGGLMGAGLSLIIYGAFMALGGLLAYARDKNAIARNIGGFVGIILIACGALGWFGIRGGTYTGLVMTILMTLLFMARYRKTKKVRPAGLMMVISIIVAVLVIYFLFV